MENKLQIFTNKEFGQIRTIVRDDEYWFVGKDVAEILGYSNTQKAIRDHVDEEDKLTERFVLSGQNREVVIINESGLYSLILSSKLPKAKGFKRWVTGEILPTLRKTGSYSIKSVLPDFTNPAEAARAWANEYEAKQKALAEIEANRHKVEYFDELIDRNLLTNFRDTAKLLHMPPKKFVDWLLDKKFVYRDKHKKLKPTAGYSVKDSSDKGYFDIKEKKE